MQGTVCSLRLEQDFSPPCTERVNKGPPSFQWRERSVAKGWSRWEREGTHSVQCPGGSAGAQRWQPVQLQTPGASGTCSAHTNHHKSTVKESKQNRSCPLKILMWLPSQIPFFVKKNLLIDNWYCMTVSMQDCLCWQRIHTSVHESERERERDVCIFQGL